MAGHGPSARCHQHPLKYQLGRRPAGPLRDPGRPVALLPVLEQVLIVQVPVLPQLQDRQQHDKSAEG